MLGWKITMNLKSCMITEREGSADECTEGWASVTVAPVLLSHESTEHYTPQYVLDAVIACMGAIDLDPRSNSKEIPNVLAARHFTIQDNRLVQLW